MYDQAVPCLNATLFETKQGKHMTWNDDRICNNCVRILDLFAKRRELATQFDETGV